MLFLSCFYSIDLLAQRDRHQGSRNRDQGSRGQATVRQPSFHREAPNLNHFPSQERNRSTSNINRGGNNNNRQENRFTPDNRPNRPGNEITYNRPRNDRNRTDYGNYNRRDNNFNYGNRGNRGYYGNNNYRRPLYNPHNPNWRYAYVPRRYSIFNRLPSSYFSINFGGFGYRYYDGIFYRPYHNVFRVVAPPIGIYVNVLPFGYSRIYVHDYPYYYYNGTYYDHRDDHYTVVSPPVGAIVESLPDGYETVTIDGETYYTVDGAQYKPVTQDNGEIWYEVIKAN